MKLAPTALTLCAGIALLMGGNTLYAQDADASKTMDAEVNLLRKNLRDQKKQIIAANLPLNGDEAARFWPVYGSFTEETIKLNDQRYAIVKDYAASYRSMTDAQAAEFIRRWIGVDQAGIKLRLDWIPKFEKAIGEKKAAMFFQIDRRILFMQELQLSSQVPLVEP